MELDLLYFLLSFLQALSAANAKSEAAHEHPLRLLAEYVKNIAERDSTVFSPVLSHWNTQSSAISASLLHSLYGRELASIYTSDYEFHFLVTYG